MYKTKDRKYMVISIDAGGKAQYTFRVKSPEDNRNRQTTPQNNKGQYNKTIILLSGKRAFPLQSKNKILMYASIW